MQALGALRLLSVRPIIEPDQHGDPRPAGSAVLVRHKRERFLLSAAHVLDRTGVVLYVGTATTWKELPQPYHFTIAPASPNVADDPFDVGFIHLPPGLADSLDGCAFLDESDCDLTEQPSFENGARSLYLALGWPQNRFKFNWRDKKTKLDNLGYFGPAAPVDHYERLRLDPSVHLLVGFDEDSAVSSAGSVGLAPKLQGISGGGVWRVNSLATGDPAADKLVAVTVRREPQMGCIVATRLHVLFAAITRQFRFGPAA
jgi:hypothetical protein